VPCLRLTNVSGKVAYVRRRRHRLQQLYDTLMWHSSLWHTDVTLIPMTHWCDTHPYDTLIWHSSLWHTDVTLISMTHSCDTHPYDTLMWHSSLWHTDVTLLSVSWSDVIYNLSIPSQFLQVSDYTARRHRHRSVSNLSNVITQQWLTDLSDTLN